MPTDPEQSEWFSRELEPHGLSLRLYLSRQFPTLPEVEDIVQESFIRVHREWEKGALGSPRALLFSCARHLAIDSVRRQKVIRFESKTENYDSSVFIDTDDVAETVSKRHEFDLLKQAIQSLPARCRQVMTLRTAYGLPQNEIAARLGITENVVEEQLAEGLRTQDSEQTRWFVEEVHPHEPSLKAYLRVAFPVVHDVDDVVHESYLRLWCRNLVKPIAFTRAYLFQVARHVALDLIRRERISPVEGVGDLSNLYVLEEGNDFADKVDKADGIRLLSKGLATLPPRAREVLILRKLEGLSQKQVASRLGIAEKTVDEHLSRGKKRLGQYLRKCGLEGRDDR